MPQTMDIAFDGQEIGQGYNSQTRESLGTGLTMSDVSEDPAASGQEVTTVFTSVTLQLERAHAASATLVAIGLAALVLDANGKVLAANNLIEALEGYIRWRAPDRVSLWDKPADELLRGAIAAIAQGADESVSVRSFPVRNILAEGAMVVHVIPIRLDIFARCAAALVLTPVTLPQAPPAELVQSLFDLTPAEARVARSLASGKTVEDIAAERSITEHGPHTCARSLAENRTNSSIRGRRAAHRDVLDAADPARLAQHFAQ